jgi:hypothetical protein
MPDYASILRRSISALPDSSPEMRDAVYQRARAALARQLTAVDPPLSTREIQAQHQELEDAVARLEADYSTLPDASTSGLDEASGEDGYFYSGSQADSGPTAAAASASVSAAPAAELRRDAYDEPSAGPYDGDTESADDDYDDEESGSRAPLLIGLLIVLLVVGGALAYGYSERDRLFALFGSSGAGDIAATVDPASVSSPAAVNSAPATTGADKRPDRLANGPDSPPAPASPPPAPVLAQQEPAPTPPSDAPAPAEPLPAEASAGLAGEQQTAALEQPGQSIVEQRAIYYFQGAEGTPGQATNGNVTWAQATRDNGPAIQATLKLADQEVTTIVTIYKNSDPSLPASHLVEVQFSGQIGPTPVQRVPALVIKQTEQARGQPLTGAAVPVTNELFWIALSDDEEEVTRNLQLLREGSWFDIPILFTDGTRALLTFEKGIPGDRVFETALAAWIPG